MMPRRRKTKGQLEATLTAILTNQPMARGNNVHSLGGMCTAQSGRATESLGDLLDMYVAVHCGVLHPCRVTLWGAQMEKARETNLEVDGGD